MNRRGPAILLGALCLAPGLASACDGLAIESAWVRRPAPGAAVAAAYFIALNRGSRAVVVNAVDSADFDMSMLHETRYSEGRAQMRRLASFEVAAGGEFRAEPGGVHLMLGGPHTGLDTMIEATIEFTCAEGPSLVVRAPLRRSAPAVGDP